MSLQRTVYKENTVFTPNRPQRDIELKQTSPFRHPLKQNPHPCPLPICPQLSLSYLKHTKSLLQISIQLIGGSLRTFEDGRVEVITPTMRLTMLPNQSQLNQSLTLKQSQLISQIEQFCQHKEYDRLIKEASSLLKYSPEVSLSEHFQDKGGVYGRHFDLVWKDRVYRWDETQKHLEETYR